MKKIIAISFLILCGLAWFPVIGSAMYANFVSQSVPTTMEGGKIYSVSITMKNPNISGWGQPGWEQALYWSEANKCRLGSQNPQDSRIWGVSRIYLGSSEVIKLNTNKTFTFDVTAPTTAGSYNFQWRMVQDGVAWFGDKTPNVAITVTSPCVPKTCSQLGTSCGAVSDGCGGILNCGACATGYSCTANKCVANCIPKTCGKLGYNCGTASDGCGNTLNCGTCASGYSCSNGQCAAQCIDECSSSGAKRCNDNGYQTCGNYDSDSCLEWSDIVVCPDEKACSLGVCLARSLKHCSEANSYQFCKNYENNSCLEWSEVINCPSGQSCANGVCFACVPMTVSGCKVCNLSGTGWTDDNSKCLAGQTCSNGVCIASGKNDNTNNANNTIDNIGNILPKVNITINGNVKKASVGAGGFVVLDWDVINADICRASGDWSGNQPIKGSMRATVINPKKYVITCSNSAGSASGEVSVEISGLVNNPSEILKPSIANSINTANAPMARQQIIDKINELKSIIDVLTQQLQAIIGQQNGGFLCEQITRDLLYGIRGDEQVKCLQEVLKFENFAVVPTGDFGGITRTAVIQFQEKYASEILLPVGLNRGSGYVGQLTREKINRIISGKK